MLFLAVQGLVGQGIAAQAFAEAAKVPCHSVESAQTSDKNLQHHTNNNQQTEHSQNQPSCCMTDCDMGSCFTAVIPADYPLNSSLFPFSETTYLALLSDSQTVSLFRPPIIRWHSIVTSAVCPWGQSMAAYRFKLPKFPRWKTGFLNDMDQCYEHCIFDQKYFWDRSWNFLYDR